MYPLGPAEAEQDVFQKERYIVHAVYAELNPMIIFLIPTEKSFYPANNRLMT